MSTGNFRLLTRSLFVEECPEGEEKHILWSLSDTEVWEPKTKRWVPSACLVYIHADDEYDAMRKLVGSAKQWDALKACKWFNTHLDQWKTEQVYMQKSAIRAELLRGALSGGPGYVSAARTFLDMLEGSSKGKVGRPKKDKEPSKSPTTQVDDDHARIVNLYE